MRLFWTKKEVVELAPDLSASFDSDGHNFAGFSGAGVYTLSILLLNARAELKKISEQDDTEMILDPTWAKRVAIHALEARQ